MGHHLRKTDKSPYREGVVLEAQDEKHCTVDLGLDEHVLVKGIAQVGARVTVRVGGDVSGQFRGRSDACSYQIY
jgi:predicted SPOUT superfamily RNA methylase MTH1